MQQELRHAHSAFLGRQSLPGRPSPLLLRPQRSDRGPGQHTTTCMASKGELFKLLSTWLLGKSTPTQADL